MLDHPRLDVLDGVPAARRIGAGVETVQEDVEDAAFILAVVVEVVAEDLPGSDALEVWRLVGGDVQLHRGEVADAGQTDVAVAPRLLGQPLDDVGAVFALVMGEQPVVGALGVAGASQVADDVDVASFGIEAWIAGLDGGLKARLAERLRRGLEGL